MFVREFLAVSWPAFVKPLCLFGLFGTDGMRPGITEAKPDRSFLGGEFCWRFDYGAQWITNLAGVFAIGVIDAPELIARLRCQSRGCAHEDSSAQPSCAKMYQLHKIRGQSV